VSEPLVERATGWSLGAAHSAEYTKLVRRLRILGIVWSTVGLVGGVAAAAIIDALGARQVAIAALLAVPPAAILVGRRSLAAASAPLRAGALVGTWLAKESLVDPEGRITPAAEALVDRAETAGGGPEERQRCLALAAYASARARSLAGRKDWLDPFVHVAPQLDLSEFRAALTRRPRRRIPLWAWVVLLPLAAIGGGLLVLSVLTATGGIRGG
jgi:hypothetical protein